ncbi:hypothetical protein CVT24_010816 [Panaeolus cyanescens]|uniref:Uncharacterized protein n=1 Tax=Panaeolus cyanescens TaxID=181874 RepID=A0A409WQD9_9AGAR|nr:hypothetical protein CVT24_010816 [Panaeolus cyanescens]
MAVTYALAEEAAEVILNPASTPNANNSGNGGSGSGGSGTGNGGGSNGGNGGATGGAWRVGGGMAGQKITPGLNSSPSPSPKLKPMSTSMPTPTPPTATRFTTPGVLTVTPTPMATPPPDTPSPSPTAQTPTSRPKISTSKVFGYSVICGAVIGLLMLMGWAIWLYRRRSHRALGDRYMFTSTIIRPFTRPGLERGSVAVGEQLESRRQRKSAMFHDKTAMGKSSSTNDSTERVNDVAAGARSIRTIPGSFRTVSTAPPPYCSVKGSTRSGFFAGSSALP